MDLVELHSGQKRTVTCSQAENTDAWALNVICPSSIVLYGASSDDLRQRDGDHNTQLDRLFGNRGYRAI